MIINDEYASIKDAGYKTAAILSETHISQEKFLKNIEHEKRKINNVEMQRIFELTAIYPNDIDFIDYLYNIGTNQEKKKKEELNWPDEIIAEKIQEEQKYKLSNLLSWSNAILYLWWKT